MLMLEDLKKRPALMQNLINSMEDNGYQSIISAGKLCANYPSGLVREIKQYGPLFDKADLAFAGASHGNIIGPLFALEVKTSNDYVILKEYLTVSRKAVDKLPQKFFEEELTALAIVISIFYPSISNIKLPIGISEFSNQECEIKKLSGAYFLNILKHRNGFYPLLL